MKIKTWRHLNHIKLPSSNNEIEISDIVEKIITSILYKNSNYLNFIILEEAYFISVSGKIKNKQEFIEEIISSGYVRDLKYLNACISINGDNIATVSYTRYILYLNFRETFTNRCYVLQKSNNYWKILKSEPNK